MKQIQPFKAMTSLMTLESDAQMVADYEVALLAFDLVLKQKNANSHTAAVKVADVKTDAGWRGLSAQVKTMLNYPSKVARVVTKRVIAIVNKCGDITNLAYSEFIDDVNFYIEREHKTLPLAKQILILQLLTIVTLTPELQ